jgi:hypothetical protein
MAKLVDSRSTEGARGHFKALGRNAGPFCCVGLSDPEKMDLTQPKEEARNGVGGAPRPRSIAIHLPRQGHSAPQPGAFRGVLRFMVLKDRIVWLFEIGRRLRAEFAALVSEPLPKRLAALVAQLEPQREEPPPPYADDPQAGKTEHSL